MSGTDNTRAEAIEAAARATATYWQDEVAAADECDREAGKAAVDAAVPHLLAPVRELAKELVNHGRNAQQTTDGHMLRKMLDAIEAEATSEGGRS